MKEAAHNKIIRLGLGAAMLILLGLLVALTVVNQFRDAQVDSISVEDRRRLHEHDDYQDNERRNLTEQLQELRKRVLKFEQRKK